MLNLLSFSYSALYPSIVKSSVRIAMSSPDSLMPTLKIGSVSISIALLSPSCEPTASSLSGRAPSSRSIPLFFTPMQTSPNKLETGPKLVNLPCPASTMRLDRSPFRSNESKRSEESCRYLSGLRDSIALEFNLQFFCHAWR